MPTPSRTSSQSAATRLPGAHAIVQAVARTATQPIVAPARTRVSATICITDGFAVATDASSYALPCATARIPYLIGEGDPSTFRAPNQPIMQFKELEVDHARYASWKAWCAEEGKRERLDMLYRTAERARRRWARRADKLTLADPPAA